VQFDAEGLPGQSGAAGFTAEGEVDYENQRTRMTMDLGSLSGLFGQAAEGKDLSFDVIVDGRPSTCASHCLSSCGRRQAWLKLDAEIAERGRPEELGQLDQGDPSKALAYLGTRGDFEEIGTEQVRGVETTHYKGAIDLARRSTRFPRQRAAREAARRGRCHRACRPRRGSTATATCAR
jgi:hypothetical protein